MIGIEMERSADFGTQFYVGETPLQWREESGYRWS